MIDTLFFFVPTLNLLLSVGALLLLVVTAGLAYALVKRQPLLWLDRWLWPLIIGTSLSGVALSLLYSEILLFIPCSLCWLQRVALYPQAILAIVAWRRGDTTHFPIYGIALSLFGTLVAIYHYLYQLLPTDIREGFAPCLADGSADCADKIMNVFGFVTFPFISAATFVFLIVVYWTLLRRHTL